MLVSINIFCVLDLHSSWEKLDINQGVHITGIEKIDNSIIIVTSDFNNKLEPSGILRTTDNGGKWLEQDYFLPSFMPLFDIEKSNSDIGLVIMELSATFRTFYTTNIYKKDLALLPPHFLLGSG